jgi:hypothetical protein
MEAMNGKKTPEREALDRLADFLVDDIWATPDEDLFAEFQEDKGDPSRNAAEMRALFEASRILVNKHRLAAAKAAVASANTRQRAPSKAVFDIAGARQRLRDLIESPLARELTLAARKESELTDNDIISMLEILDELGVLSKDGDSKKS